MDHSKIQRLSKICDLLEKIVTGEEFIEVRLGNAEVGGVNLRIKGNTLYTNLADLPNVTVQIPDAWLNKATQLYENLREKLKQEIPP